MISQESRRLAGILLVILPTVLYGGYFLLTQLISPGSGYMDNPLRQNLFRVGHAHAGVLLVLSLVALRYVDEARLSEGWKWYVRFSTPVGSDISPGSILLFRAFAARRCAERLHLSCVRGGGGLGDWTSRFGSGAA